MNIDFEQMQRDLSETRQDLRVVLDYLKQFSPQTPLPEESPLNVQQAAELLDVTTATVYDLVHKRRIPSHRPGKRLYFLRSELMDWIRNGRRMTVDELNSAASDRPTRTKRSTSVHA